MNGFSPFTVSVVGRSLAAALLAGGLLASTAWPGYRCWPPGQYDWRWWTYLMLSGLATGGMLAAGYFDWNSWTLPRPESFVLDMVLLVVGNVGFASATFGLGIQERGGQAGELRTGGFYQYSRNPQLLLLFVVLLGSISFANSDAVLIVAVAMGTWFALMPLAEEPWLQGQYGEEYRRYRQSTPRFIDTRTGRRLLRSIGRFNDGGY